MNLIKHLDGYPTELEAVALDSELGPFRARLEAARERIAQLTIERDQAAAELEKHRAVLADVNARTDWSKKSAADAAVNHLPRIIQQAESDITQAKREIEAIKDHNHPQRLWSEFYGISRELRKGDNPMNWRETRPFESKIQTGLARMTAIAGPSAVPLIDDEPEAKAA